MTHYHPIFLFFCIEKLGQIINQKVTQGKWKGMRASRNGPIITHFLFADDIILFFKASESNCEKINDVLNSFCDMPCLKISISKSKVHVSLNVSRTQTRRFSRKLGFPLTKNLGKYLGIPLVHNRNSKDHYNSSLKGSKTG